MANEQNVAAVDHAAVLRHQLQALSASVSAGLGGAVLSADIAYGELTVVVDARAVDSAR